MENKEIRSDFLRNWYGPRNFVFGTLYRALDGLYMPNHTINEEQLGTYLHPRLGLDRELEFLIGMQCVREDDKALDKDDFRKAVRSGDLIDIYDFVSGRSIYDREGSASFNTPKSLLKYMRDRRLENSNLTEEEQKGLIEEAEKLNANQGRLRKELSQVPESIVDDLRRNILKSPLEYKFKCQQLDKIRPNSSSKRYMDFQVYDPSQSGPDEVTERYIGKVSEMLSSLPVKNPQIDLF